MKDFFLAAKPPPNLAKELSGLTIVFHIKMKRKNRHSKILQQHWTFWYPFNPVLLIFFANFTKNSAPVGWELPKLRNGGVFRREFGAGLRASVSPPKMNKAGFAPENRISFCGVHHKNLVTWWSRVSPIFCRVVSGDYGKPCFEGKDCIPTIHFSGAMLISGRLVI